MNNIEAAQKHPIVAILLTLNGGFLDAFTYLGHDKVFANSMTGNIVMLAVSLGGGDIQQTLRHIWPLIGFVCGILAARLLQLIASRHPSRLAIISLVFEIAFLALAALKDLPEFWLLAGVAFVATQQSTFFTHLGNQTYSSVMTTGNLRRCLQIFLEPQFRRSRPPGCAMPRALAPLVSVSCSARWQAD